MPLSYPVLTTLRDGHSSLRAEARIVSCLLQGPREKGLRKVTSLGLRRVHVVLFPADEGLLT